MKKSICLALLSIFTLVGCNNSTTNSENNSSLIGITDKPNSSNSESVNTKEPTSININIVSAKKILKVGEKLVVNPIILPSDSNQNFTLKSSNEEVLAIENNNTLVAKKPGGRILITATTSNGINSRAYVSVVSNSKSYEELIQKLGRSSNLELEKVNKATLTFKDTNNNKITRDETYTYNAYSDNKLILDRSKQEYGKNVIQKQVIAIENDRLYSYYQELDSKTNKMVFKNNETYLKTITDSNEVLENGYININDAKNSVGLLNYRGSYGLANVALDLYINGNSYLGEDAAKQKAVYQKDNSTFTVSSEYIDEYKNHNILSLKLVFTDDILTSFVGKKEIYLDSNGVKGNLQRSYEFNFNQEIGNKASAPSDKFLTLNDLLYSSYDINLTINGEAVADNVVYLNKPVRFNVSNLLPLTGNPYLDKIEIKEVSDPKVFEISQDKQYVTPLKATTEASITIGGVNTNIRKTFSLIVKGTIPESLSIANPDPNNYKNTLPSTLLINKKRTIIVDSQPYTSLADLQVELVENNANASVSNINNNQFDLIASKVGSVKLKISDKNNNKASIEKTINFVENNDDGLITAFTNIKGINGLTALHDLVVSKDQTNNSGTLSINFYDDEYYDAEYIFTAKWSISNKKFTLTNVKSTPVDTATLSNPYLLAGLSFNESLDVLNVSIADSDLSGYLLEYKAYLY